MACLSVCLFSLSIFLSFYLSSLCGLCSRLICFCLCLRAWLTVSASVCFLSFVFCLSSSAMWCAVGVHRVVCVCLCLYVQVHVYVYVYKDVNVFV